MGKIEISDIFEQAISDINAENEKIDSDHRNFTKKTKKLQS